MEDAQKQTRIEVNERAYGIEYKFSDYPAGEQWTPETPVSYVIGVKYSELWPIVDEAVKMLQKSPARRSKWRRVLEALRS